MISIKNSQKNNKNKIIKKQARKSELKNIFF